MLRRLVQWLKRLFQSLFGGQNTPANVVTDVPKEPAPPLTDTDLEFLFTELLEGVHQARGEAWASKWLQNIEHRVSTERWLEWLQRFGERLLASSTPNNELAARLVQLGELGIGEIGDTAYDIGMQVLRRNQGEPIWEYDGPDAVSTSLSLEDSYPVSEQAQPGEGEYFSGEEYLPTEGENIPAEGEYQTVTIDQLFVMLQQDENLRQQIAQQLAIETDDPEVIVQELINQYNASNESTTDQP
ncbi:hypothetical protein JYQ62_36210 [Nostoc sp. UHCC 0702]|nr:hypothetical protein JYQ62_36210 [Nostoc sp. UHCC 0702]